MAPMPCPTQPSPRRDNKACCAKQTFEETHYGHVGKSRRVLLTKNSRYQLGSWLATRPPARPPPASQPAVPLPQLMGEAHHASRGKHMPLTRS